MCPGLKFCMPLCLLIFISISQISGAIRYKEACFDSVEVKADLYYRTAPDYEMNPDSLFMDFYEPKGDTALTRPVVVLLYGGSFITGSRKDALITTYSSYLARCGYAVFAIDYRIGINLLAASLQAELPAATYRAVQDSRAAVRFIRKNAEVFKIDTTRIFGMGYSAGAITLLHHAYLDLAEASQNQLLVAAVSLLGDLDQGDNLQYSSKIDCIINCCGAIADTSWIKAGDTPILSFHGTNDQTVPYGTGYAFNNPSTTLLFGSSIIDQKAKTVGIPSVLISFEGAGHSLEGEPRITIPITTVNFLYGLMNGSPIRKKIPWKSDRIVSHTLANQYFDLSGRLIKKQVRTSSALIVHRNQNTTTPVLIMNSNVAKQ